MIKSHSEAQLSAFSQGRAGRQWTSVSDVRQYEPEVAAGGLDWTCVSVPSPSEPPCCFPTIYATSQKLLYQPEAQTDVLQDVRKRKGHTPPPGETQWKTQRLTLIHFLFVSLMFSNILFSVVLDVLHAVVGELPVGATSSRSAENL